MCLLLHGRRHHLTNPLLFMPLIVVPLLTEVSSVQTLINDSIDTAVNVDAMSTMIMDQLKEVGCKTILRLVERAIFYCGDATRFDVFRGT